MLENISDDDGQRLIKLARKSIAQNFISDDDAIDRLRQDVSESILKEYRGTFVTLNKKGRLRGCIGNIEPVKTIFEGIMDNAMHAAFKDSRFSPLSEDELADTQVEISILTQAEPLDYIDGNDLISKLKPHVHGVIIEKGYRKATFLPQVWSQLSRPDDFLSHLCMKAGLHSDEWKKGGLIVSTYKVQVFEESL